MVCRPNGRTKKPPAEITYATELLPEHLSQINLRSRQNWCRHATICPQRLNGVLTIVLENKAMEQAQFRINDPQFLDAETGISTLLQRQWPGSVKSDLLPVRVTQSRGQRLLDHVVYRLGDDLVPDHRRVGGIPEKVLIRVRHHGATMR